MSRKANRRPKKNRDADYYQARQLVEKHGLIVMVKRQWQLFAMVIPLVGLLMLFNVFPLWGWSYAFFEATPKMYPDWSAFVGLEMFKRAYSLQKFWLALRNTLAISSMNIAFSFVSAVGFALMLNELRVRWFKKTVQTISYLPHFVSWVVCATLVNLALSPEGGVINNILVSLGIINGPVNWLLSESPVFWFIIVLSNIWKEMGWSAIIYLAAIAGIDSEIYEAAAIDGANRIRRVFSITLPSIYPTMKLLLILSLGGLMSAGFEQLLLLQRPNTLQFSEVLDTYVFRLVWGTPAQMKYYIPIGTAVGIVNSIVSFILVFSANKVVEKVSGDGII